MLRFVIIFIGLLTFALPGSPEAEAASGEEIYNFYCAQCHGPTGKGDGINVTEDMPATPRDLSNAAEMNKLSDADIKNVVLDGGPAMGKSGVMPPWKKTLTDGEVDSIVKHLRKLCNCKGK